MSASSPKPPRLEVEWHHLQKFYFRNRPLIWITITNTGGECTLYTSGEIRGQKAISLGMGEYKLAQNEVLELGFFRSDHDKLVIEEHMIRSGCLTYHTRLVAVNDDGYDVFEETKDILVEIPASSS